jgi:recombination protein RecA
MTKDEKILCLAMVLGDGYIRKDCPSLRISHGPKQEEYLRWKAALLEKATGTTPVITSVVHNHKSGRKYPGFQMGVSHKFFRVLRNRCYKNGKHHIDRTILDKLTPQALAIWYMDDGSLYPKKRNGVTHAHELVLSLCVSEEYATVVKDYFLEKWGVTFTIKRNKGLCSIRCGTREARKFIPIVKPFVIQSLQYKVNL